MTLHPRAGRAGSRRRRRARRTPAQPLPIRRPVVVIYTDGACKGNPGPGGWGAWLPAPAATRRNCSAARLLTTNNRMELTAVIEALGALKRPCEVTLHTDSQYVRKGITEWIHGWKAARLEDRRQEAGEERRPVAAARLAGAGGHAIDWRWVRGHAGDPGNERADALANKGAAAFMR